MANVVVFGTGSMAHIYSDIICCSRSGNLLGAVGNRPANSEKFAKKYSVPVTDHGQYYKLLKSVPDVDTVLIATPEWVRTEPMAAAMEYGKNIILEKPFADSVDIGHKLFQDLSRYNHKFRIAHVLRYSSRFLALKKAVEEEQIGEIRHIYARRHSNHIRVKRVLGKTDLSYWLTPHDVDMMCWLLNSEVSEVYATSRNKLRAEDDFLTVHLKFQNSVQAVLQISWCQPPVSGVGREASFEIWGRQGQIELADNDMNIRVLTQNQKVHTPDTYEHFRVGTLYRGIFESMLESYLKDMHGPEGTDCDSMEAARGGLHTVEVGHAIRQSIETGISVKLKHEKK